MYWFKPGELYNGMYKQDRILLFILGFSNMRNYRSSDEKFNIIMGAINIGNLNA